MFSNFAMSEMLVILLVAVVVIGPKELPGMLRSFGKMMGKVKRMANDFQGQIDDAIRETEIEEVTSTAFKPLEDAKKSMENIQNAVNEQARLDAGEIDESQLGPETLKLKKELKEKSEATRASVASNAEAKSKATTAAKKPTAKKTAAAKTNAAKKSPSTRAKKPAATKASSAKVATKKPARKPATKRTPAKAKA